MRSCVIAALLLLASCGRFSSEQVEAFTSVRPLQDDLGRYEVIVNLPPGMDIRPGGARLNVSATHADTRATTSATYELARRNASAGRIVYSIAEADLPRLAGQQALIREWSAETGGRTDGDFGIQVDTCQNGAGPDLNDRLSVQLVTLPQRTQRTLIPPTPVRNFVITAGDNEIMMAPC